VLALGAGGLHVVANYAKVAIQEVAANNKLLGEVYEKIVIYIGIIANNVISSDR
jgi:hypothetical protein